MEVIFATDSQYPRDPREHIVRVPRIVLVAVESEKDPFE